MISLVNHWMKILKITDWTQDLYFSKDCFYLEVTENRSNRSLTMKGHFSYITRHMNIRLCWHLFICSVMADLTALLTSLPLVAEMCLPLYSSKSLKWERNWFDPSTSWRRTAWEVEWPQEGGLGKTAESLLYISILSTSFDL